MSQRQNAEECMLNYETEKTCLAISLFVQKNWKVQLFHATNIVYLSKTFDHIYTLRS